MRGDEKLNILLVDDQPAKLLSYEVILRDIDENLIKASSGREALEHLLRSEIAVVLMDVCMPELRGYEMGAVDYVPIPVIPEVLRAKVKIFTELYRKSRQLEALNAELEQRVA